MLIKGIWGSSLCVDTDRGCFIMSRANSGSLGMRVVFLLFMRFVSDVLAYLPFCYVFIMRCRLRNGPSYEKVITRESVIVIEGYPRCANSFAVKAFRMSNDPGRQLRVATHLHSPAHVTVGLQYQLPTLVLIRNPDEAIPSWLALAIQLNKFGDYQLSARERRVLVRYWTHYFYFFYHRLEKYQSRFVLADFEETTHDFNHVLQQVNRKFGSDFDAFEHSERAVKEIFNSSKVHLSPSKERDSLKQVFRDIYFSEMNRKHRECAQAIYRRMLELKGNIL